MNEQITTPLESTDAKLIDNCLEGMPGFIQILAAYYSQFLETDFKRGREPKRKFASKDKNGKLCGIKTLRYPTFRAQLLEQLEATDPDSFFVTSGQHRTRLSATMDAALKAAIESVPLTKLTEDLGAYKGKLVTRLQQEGLDLELETEVALENILLILDRHAVTPILDVVAPVFERQSSSFIAMEQLITYSDDIVRVLSTDLFDVLPTAISNLVFRNDETVLSDALTMLSDEKPIREALATYFAGFATADLFTELRELIANLKVTENSQLYLNLGEARFGKSSFPLYYLPITAEIEPKGIRVELQKHLFANKKAVGYVLDAQAKEQGQSIPNPLSERIFYKGQSESLLSTAEITLHKVLAALQSQGEFNLSAIGESTVTGPGFRISNDLSITLADKSDESIVNDYEALITGLEGGHELIGAFEELISDFLTSNPSSIEGDVEKEWDETNTPSRLVFESPLPLAEEQRKVQAAIRHPDSRLIAVEGPPGTGKSHTIAAIAFEMILNGKNILILSDKKEALDVAEGKLNDVISKVRGSETTYVNPILRLGKSDSNFSNILKPNAIQKLKTSVSTFKKCANQFDRDIKGTENGLKSAIEQTIVKGESIKLTDVEAYHQLESELFENHPELEELDVELDAGLGVLARLAETLDKHRSALAPEFAKGDSSEVLSKVVRLQAPLAGSPSAATQLLPRYPKLDFDQISKLGPLITEVESLRIPIFGYLFAGGRLRALAAQLEPILGVLPSKPQKIIYELRAIKALPSELKNTLEQFTLDEDDLPLYSRLIARRFELSESDAGLLEQFHSLELDDYEEAGIPCNVKDLLSLSPSQKTMFSSLDELMVQRKTLEDAFSALPKFDYLRDKTQLESLYATRLANTIDQRVTSFADRNKADAKTLQRIIRNKERFPTDKFSVLKEAFPCMIAGLRDYAEFIPFERDLFDLVIIDEASQVSIAQALPAILRAKKVIVMGDRRQFGNVKTANASKQMNLGYFSEVKDVFKNTVANGDISMLTRCDLFNITNSVMDFFEMTSNFSIQLRKHFRGYPEMISFSSKHYYDHNLQALKIRGKPLDQVLEFLPTPDPDAAEVTRNANRQEADLIIKQLEELCENEDPPSVAVITPFKEQQRLISGLVTDHDRYQEFAEKLKIAVFTFDSCQGEERDWIFYSMVANRDNDRLNYIFPPDLHSASEDDIDGKLKFQRLNVGFSRGKEKLIFVHSKPIEEFRGAIFQALKHYKIVLETADYPSAEDVDPSSPMEAQVLDWLKATAFATANVGRLEIIPQFKLGAYLKALDPSYSHPLYKVDFLLRLSDGEHVHQVIVEYDGFEFHFIQGDVTAGNWPSFLTPADVERECILESYGYKMLRINRFNVGSDPISMLDDRLDALFEALGNKDSQHQALTEVQQETAENVKGLDEGTHKRCSKCETIRTKEDFYDSSLKSKYGRVCKSCKGTGYRSKRKKTTYRRRYSKWT